MNQDFTEVLAGSIIRLVDDTVSMITATISHQRNLSTIL